MKKTYSVYCYVFRGKTTLVAKGLTLEQAQRCCNSPETSSRTATREKAVQRTKELGPWFYGYVEENPEPKSQFHVSLVEALIANYHGLGPGRYKNHRLYDW